MKLITHSKTPFIVVQQKDFSPTEKMLVPVDFTKEIKQELPAVIQYALFNANAFKQIITTLTFKRSDTSNTGFFEDRLDIQN